MGEGVGLKAVRGLSTRATVNFNRTLCTSCLLQELLLSLFKALPIFISYEYRSFCVAMLRFYLQKFMLLSKLNTIIQQLMKFSIFLC